MASFLTLAGAVLGPVVGIYLADKMVNVKTDSLDKSLEKAALANGGVALAGYALGQFGGKAGASGVPGQIYDFATGTMLGAGVLTGVALGARAVTPAHAQAQPPAIAPTPITKALTAARTPAPATQAGWPPGAYLRGSYYGG